MNKHLIALTAGAALLLAGAAHATVINFDDLSTGAGTSKAFAKDYVYAGLTWSSSAASSTSTWTVATNDKPGYDNGAHSGKQFLFNGFGVNNLSIGSTDLFDFGGAWFAAPNVAAKASWINIAAYDAANLLIGSTGNVDISTTFSFIAADFHNVARLIISRDGGGAQRFFEMDDLVFSRASQVPEPGAFALTGLGLLAMGWMRRRRSVAAARAPAV